MSDFDAKQLLTAATLEESEGRQDLTNKLWEILDKVNTRHQPQDKSIDLANKDVMENIARLWAMAAQFKDMSVVAQASGRIEVAMTKDQFFDRLMLGYA